MEDIKDKISKNLVTLRTRANLTQLQLAEMLSYSDKAVSKWERGEAIPDLRVLIKLAEIYGVTLDELVKSDEISPKAEPKKHLNGKRAFIVALSAVLVWFIATGVYMTFYFIYPTAAHAYFAFIVAPLPTAIVFTVFSAKWGNRITTAISCSLIVWFSALIIYMCVITFAVFPPIYFIWVIAGVFEILLILWFAFRGFAAKKNKNKEEK